MAVEKHGFRWAVLGLSWFAWLMQGTAMLSIGAMLALLIPALGLTAVQAGTLMAISWVPGILFAIPIGLLADKYGGRKLGALGLLILAIGLVLIALSTTFGMLVVARFIIGIGVTLCVVPPQTWTTRWFPPEELGTALGILISGYSGSGIIGIFAMGYILTALGIYWTTIMFAIICLIWMIVFIIARRELPPGAETVANPGSSISLGEAVAQAFKSVELWKVGIAWFAIVGIFTAYATFAVVTFQATLGLDLGTAAAVAGVASLTAVPFHIAGGWLSDKLKPRFGRKILIWLPTLICALAYYLVGWATALVFAMIGIVLIGIFNWVSNAATFSGGAEAVDPTIVGAAFGFLAFTSSLGSLILPLIMGAVFDATGSWVLTWAVPAIVAFLGAIVGAIIKK